MRYIIISILTVCLSACTAKKIQRDRLKEAITNYEKAENAAELDEAKAEILYICEYRRNKCW